MQKWGLRVLLKNIFCKRFSIKKQKCFGIIRVALIRWLNKLEYHKLINWFKLKLRLDRDLIIKARWVFYFILNQNKRFRNGNKLRKYREAFYEFR